MRAKWLTVAAAGALVIVVACSKHDSPTAPSGVATSPAGAAATAISVTGNRSMAGPGDTTQLTAMVRFADGTTRDVTGQADWRANGDGYQVVTVSSPGLLTAVRYGKTQVSVSWSAGSTTLRSNTDVRVVPAGAFLLTGTVITSTGALLPGAKVEVTSAAGTMDATTVNGFYELPAAGDALLRAEKDAFRRAEKRVTVGGDDFINLTLLRADSGGCTGTYQLAFTASASCNLPPAAMQRTYEAHVEQVEQTLYVIFDDQQFVGWGGNAGFTGTRQGDAVRFEIGDNIMDAWCLIERIPTVGDLHYAGTATGTISDGLIVATLKGSISLGPASSTTYATACTADDHRLVFKRVDTASYLSTHSIRR